MRLKNLKTILIILSFLVLSTTSFANTEQAGNTSNETFENQSNLSSVNSDVAAIDLSEDQILVLFPQGDLYPFNIADPHRVGFSLQVLDYTESEIPSAGDLRVYLKAGGNVGIFRVTDKNNPELGWQFNIIASFDAMFDFDNSQDNIGWDGNYGFTVTVAPNDKWLYKYGMLHTSSHLGDEYIERTGQTRLGYTREELMAGVSHRLTNEWRLYAEGGWAFDRGNEDLMDPWRFQGGIEYVSEKKILKNLAQWYATVDVQSWEESDWDYDVSTQFGIEINSAGRRARLGLEYYEGRVPIGEFFQFYENYISLGINVDI